MIALLWACSIPEPIEVAVAVGNPLSTIDRDVDRTPFSGAAEEVRAAGGYEYVRIGERWVVGLAKGVEVGTAVDVTPIGLARNFSSRRTGHDYDELWFAVLRPKS